MSNYFHLTLDTTAPANPSITIEGGAQYTTQQLVQLALSTSDPDTIGYQMKIWGDVDPSHDNDIQATEANSQWITYQTAKQVKLSAGDGNKTLYLRIRDDVHNVSGQASDSIILDMTMPEVTIAGPDVDRISKVIGKNISAFSFQADQGFQEYKVKVVSSTGASHDTGVQIPTAGGSTNMTGTGSYIAHNPISCQITGQDLEVASPGDGQKIVKVFVRDNAGNWSA